MTIYHLNSQRHQVLSQSEEKGKGRRHIRMSATTSSLQSLLHAHSLTSCPRLRPMLHQPPSPSYFPLPQSSVQFVMHSKATRPQSHITWKAILPERRSSRLRNKREAKFDGNLQQPNSHRPLATGHRCTTPVVDQTGRFTPAACIRHHAQWRSSHSSLAYALQSCYGSMHVCSSHV